MMRPFNTALRRAPTLLLLFLAIVSVSRAQDYSTRVDAERDAKLGNPNAMRALAEMARDGVDGPQDLKLAAAIYFQLATKGLGFDAADAAFELGYFYAQGWGVEKSIPEAEDWFNRGAQTGVHLVELANLYAEGTILPRNDEKAVELYRKAGAEIELGKMYEAGRGVPQSYEKAAEQYRNGAVGNKPEAQILYADMLMAGKGVAQDTNAALD